MALDCKFYLEFLYRPLKTAALYSIFTYLEVNPTGLNGTSAWDYSPSLQTDQEQ